jgi:hypothetical protein
MDAARLSVISLPIEALLGKIKYRFKCPGIRLLRSYKVFRKTVVHRVPGMSWRWLASNNHLQL